MMVSVVSVGLLYDFSSEWNYEHGTFSKYQLVDL